jgi:predicted O-methyltransferase YrrM
MSYSTIRYLIKHPERFLYHLISIWQSPNYIYFVSRLLNLEVNTVKKNLPNKITKKNLSYAFKRSINPKSREMPLSFEEAMSCYLIIRLMKPKVVVETGVSAGRSSAFILQALEDNSYGYLYSIDPDPNAGYAIPDNLRRRWFFISKKSSEVLTSLLEGFNKVDVFLHDSLHTYENMIYEFETVWPFITKNGVMLSDDIDFNKAFQEFCKKHNVHPVFLSNNFAGIRKE